ncbi:hypothetical protein ACN9MD_09640 [Stenotrophomonas maltophilia]|uniref:hypothetical protein n=1 Tax=Stenotrophomonas maltophilia TaxID=40324 RepID=UPI003CF871E4
MSTDYDLERARQTGRWMRDAHKDRRPPFYAMGEEGMELRRAWLAGYDERDEQIRRNGR